MSLTKLKITGYLLIVSIGVFVVIGCSKNKVTNAPPPTHSSHFHNVSIANLAFTPDSLLIPTGDTVLWSNNDNVTHTVTSDTGTELGQTLTPGSSYQHLFSTANTFPYHCAIHTQMRAKIVVQ
jgi:plastocyanin